MELQYWCLFKLYNLPKTWSYYPQIQKKIPTVGGGYSPSVVSYTQSLQKSTSPPPPPPPPMCGKNAFPKHIRLSGKDKRFGQNMLCPPPPKRKWSRTRMKSHACKYSNQLTLKQWAIEYGLIFWYALYSPGGQLLWWVGVLLRAYSCPAVCAVLLQGGSPTVWEVVLVVEGPGVQYSWWVVVLLYSGAYVANRWEVVLPGGYSSLQCGRCPTITL